MLKIINTEKITDNWLNDVTTVNAVYNFIIGGRNGRKSTKIQNKILNDYFKRGDLFLLIRRKTDETVSEKWFTPYITNLVKERYKKLIIFKKTITKGERYTGYFFLTELDSSKPQIIGKVMYLSMEQKYKSNEAEIYKKLKNVVFEEFIAVNDKAYLINEVQALINLISTVFRDRNATVYLIGNTLDGQETNPYFRYFEIDDLQLKVNDLYICENEHNIKILIAYIANILPEDIPQYQQIKNNLVGTTGEWKQDRQLMQTDINTIQGEIEQKDLILIYRNKYYYIYSVTESGFERPYIYITQSLLKSSDVTTLDEFRQTLPQQHQKYNTTLLHALYPRFFAYSYTDKAFIFKPENKAVSRRILNVDTLGNIKEMTKNNDINKLEMLNQILYNVHFLCDNKSLLYWFKNERREYIKSL